MPFAFAPYSFSPVAFLSLGVLFIAWQHCTAKQAAIASFLFGFASFSTSGIWVITSFIVHAKISPILSIVIFVSFLSILAFHIAAIGWIQARYRHTNCFVHFCLLLPALWVLAEIVRSNFLTGFPFLLLGYSQLNTPLDNLAPYVGVYGMSFITAIIAGLIVLLITHPAKWRAVVPGIVGAYIFSIALGTTTWTQSSSEGINIAVLPGNRPAADRWHKKIGNPCSIISGRQACGTRTSMPFSGRKRHCPCRRIEYLKTIERNFSRLRGRQILTSSWESLKE